MQGGVDLQNDDNKSLYEESIKYGALRELIAAKLFIKQGYTVSVPSMSARYDFIAEKFPVIIRVQIKPLVSIKQKNSAKSTDGEWCIRPWSFAKGKRKPYSIEDCNVIMGVDIETGDYAIIPIDEVSGNATEYKITDYRGRNRTKYLNPIDFDDVCG